jgi:hypothetical protein
MAYAASFNIISARSSDKTSKTCGYLISTLSARIPRSPAQKAYEKSQREHDADRSVGKTSASPPPLGQPRSDTTFAQSEAVPPSNASGRCAILIAQMPGLPDVGLTLQTSLIYNHIFVNSRRTKNE